MALRLVAELGGDGSGFERMLNKAGSSAKKFSANAIMPLKNVIAGVFTVGAISSLTKSTIEWASKLRDVSDELGVNVEWLQKMQNGAKLVGADIEDIAKFIGEMNKARQEALVNPTGKDAQAFKRLGVTSGDEKNLSTQDLFDKIVKAFKNGANVQLSNDVQEVGGKSARNLISAFATQFQNDIPILAESLIDQLDDVGDQFTRISSMLKVAFAPAVIFVADMIVSAINKIKVAGAILGGLFSNLNKPSEFIRALINPKSIAEKLNGKGAIDAGAQEILRQQKEAEDNKTATDASREARHRRENSPPQFDPVAIAPKQQKSNPDALVKVGNFLGQAPSAVNVIAQQQLTVSRQQLEYIKTMSNNIVTLINKLPAVVNGGGINVPP